MFLIAEVPFIVTTPSLSTSCTVQYTDQVTGGGLHSPTCALLMIDASVLDGQCLLPHDGFCQII